MYIGCVKKINKKKPTCKHLFLCIISVSFQFELKSEPPKKVHVKHFCKGIFLCLVFVCIQFQNNWATDKKVKMLR